MVVVRWYLRYGLSYRDVIELLAERGIEVGHVIAFRWGQRFTPLLIDASRPCRHAPGDWWFVDETYLKIAGRWIYLYEPTWYRVSVGRPGLSSTPLRTALYDGARRMRS
jgi:IS6 family transposase